MKRRAWMSLLSCFSVILITLVVGCAPNIPKVVTYEEAAKTVAARGALVTPPIEQREGYEEGTATRLDVGQAAPKNGTLLDEKKLTLLIAIKAERDRRRAELEAERRKTEIQKIIYESTIVNLKAQAEARNNWWEQNKGLVGLTIGVTVGMAVVVGILYAITGGKSVQTSTSALTTSPMR